MFIGSRLKQLRKDKGLTQDKLGELLNVTKVSICCYENGTRTPCLETIEDMVSLFNVSPNYLIGKDAKVVCEDSPEYIIFMSKEDMDIISEIKKNKALYKMFLENPKRTVEFLEKKI